MKSAGLQWVCTALECILIECTHFRQENRHCVPGLGRDVFPDQETSCHPLRGQTRWTWEMARTLKNELHQDMGHLVIWGKAKAELPLLLHAYLNNTRQHAKTARKTFFAVVGRPAAARSFRCSYPIPVQRE